MATLTPAKAAQGVLNHPNFKIRLGNKFDKGDKLSMESLKQRLEPIITAAQEKKEKVEAGMFEKHMEDTFGIPKHALGDFLMNNFPKYEDGGDLDYKERVPWLGAATGVIGSLIGNKKIKLPTYNYEKFNPAKASANLVDFSRGREATMNERDLANNQIMGAARNTGSANSLMENTLAGVTGTQRAAGQAINQSLESEGNANAQILNQNSQFNSAQQVNAAQINQRNEMYKNQTDRENVLINTERADNKLAGVMSSITGYGKDLMAANQYNSMLQVLTPDNYKMVGTNDSKFKKFFGISPDAKKQFVDTGDKFSLGGYVIPKSKKLPISFRTK